MLTSCVLDKLLLFCSCCSFPNFSWPRSLESFICWGFFYDLGSGWLKIERWELYFWFSCVTERTQTFSYLKQTTFAKLFLTSRVYSVDTDGNNIFQGFLALPWMLSLLPLDGDSLQALEVHKWVTDIFCISRLFPKACGHCSFDYQYLLESRLQLTSFSLAKIPPNSDWFRE